MKEKIPAETNELFSCVWNSPLGNLRLTANAKGLTGICFDAPAGEPAILDPVLKAAINFLEKYFAGENPSLSGLKLAPTGTEFQHKVWEILQDIPYGETITYGRIAKMLSPSMSPQAVGNAVGANPIPILIPCHRVIGEKNIGGYSGGLAIKRKLLAIENIIL